jgi:hypothetical protein
MLPGTESQGSKQHPVSFSIHVQIDAYNTSLVMNFFQHFLRGEEIFLRTGVYFMHNFRLFF